MAGRLSGALADLDTISFPFDSVIYEYETHN